MDSFSLSRWLFAAVPLALLLVGMLKLRWSAPKAGAVAWITAMVIGVGVFLGDLQGISLANAKGLSLTLFVVSIIWTSVFLYNTVEQSGAVKAISQRMSGLVKEPLLQCLLLAWCLSGFIQGITGFGVPVALVAPLMYAVGFDPVTAAAATLVGHAWSITFGSMAGSFYMLQLVTKIPAADSAFWIGAVLAIPTVLTGFAVAHIYGGLNAMKKGFLPILLIGASMAATHWAVPVFGAPQLGSVLAGLVGTIVTVIISRLGLYREDATLSRRTEQTEKTMSFSTALIPYYALIALAFVTQIGPIKAAGKNWLFGLDFPAVTTGLGFDVKAEKAYAAIGLISHPAPLLVVAILVAIVAYGSIKSLNVGTLKSAWGATIKQCVPTTVSIATMVMMALVMNDTGMTSVLARGVAPVTGRFFPLFSPFIGVLGCFMTGSNTNSNVLFGAFQVETAISLGISTRIMAAVQSAGGSLGSAIAPAKVLIGSATVGLSGEENTVMKKAIPYCLLIVGVVGIIAWLSVYVFFPNVL